MQVALHVPRLPLGDDGSGGGALHALGRAGHPPRAAHPLRLHQDGHLDYPRTSARDPAYWGHHLRDTVRFADAVATLWKEPGALLMEMGPRASRCRPWRASRATDSRAPARRPDDGRHRGHRMGDPPLRRGPALGCGRAGPIPRRSGATPPSTTRGPPDLSPLERKRYWIPIRRGRLSHRPRLPRPRPAPPPTVPTAPTGPSTPPPAGRFTATVTAPAPSPHPPASPTICDAFSRTLPASRSGRAIWTRPSSSWASTRCFSRRSQPPSKRRPA